MKRIERILIGIVAFFLALLFLYLFGYGLLKTSVIAEKGYISEPIVERADNLLESIGMFLCGLFILWFFGKIEKQLPLRATIGIALTLTLVVGIFWVCAARTYPRADANSIAVAAQRIISNNFSELRRAGGYFNQHPYQVGFLSISEILQRIFGSANYLALQIFNVVCLTLAYGGVLRLTWLMSDSQRATRYAALFLLLCIQPVLYCTFLYGNILSIACSLWAAVVVVSIIKGKSKWLFLVAGLLCGLSVLYKPNGWLPTIALLIVSCLWLLSEKQWRVLPLLAALALGPVLLTGGVKALYQARGNADLSKGVPMTAYLAMGLQESSRAPGWYNEYVDRVYKAADYNPEKASERAVKNIRMRLEEFAKDPAYAFSFFHEKMTSQWNETTFEAIWISKTCQYDKKARLPFAKEVLNGQLRQPLESYMEGYTLTLYFCFAVGLGLFCWELFAKKRAIQRWYGFGMGYLAVTTMGAFIYHMIFEAKSQYLFIYLLVMIPLAATAVSRLTVRPGHDTDVLQSDIAMSGADR
ncbi:MAG: hypothetical protein PHI98_13475 [Eubacteriales bacterium]|nr:hypothetical protein [Eubacteriales bacterium]